jgi:hypothetical protein
MSQNPSALLDQNSRAIPHRSDRFRRRTKNADKSFLPRPSRVGVIRVEMKITFSRTI